MNKQWTLSIVLAAAAFTACSSDITSAQVMPKAGEAVTFAQSAPAVPPGASGPLPDFAGLVERFGPAVVNVAVVQKRQQVADMPGLSPQDPFYDFFRRFGIPQQRGTPMPARGEGSGFIISPDGYILTNAHVVNQADEVTVKLTDRREFTAKVIGSDERSDVAVLKIDAHDLPMVMVGDASKLKPGEWVVAIGSPFGFENSVTAGIVSATARSMPGESNYTPFIQTDVAVNPGNSGGPLFNMRGEVVGINSQIYSRTGGYMGLSFAVPIEVATRVKDQLIKTGKVSRGRIGVQIQEVNAQLANSFGLDRPRGALISVVQSDGPAADAGLKSGDVILKIDGRVIETSSQVPEMIANTAAGNTVKLEIWRDHQTRTIPVKVEPLEEPKNRNAQNRGDDETGRLGLALRPLTPQERREANTEGGLVVEDVSGPAALAGIEPGDIILGVNGSKVKSLQELKSAAKKGATLALLIQREDQQLFVPLHVG